MKFQIRARPRSTKTSDSSRPGPPKPSHPPSPPTPTATTTTTNPTNVTTASTTAATASATTDSANYNDNTQWSGPSIFTAVKLLLSTRLASALWMQVSDCDETYNYWEPLHFLLHGTGMQTWEYNPNYAVRSYLYIAIHLFPLLLLNIVPGWSKIIDFFFLRCLLSIVGAIGDTFLYRTLRRRTPSLAIWFLLLSSMGTGPFISSSALLPSSTAMCCTSFALSYWLDAEQTGVQSNYKWAIFSVALAGLLAWPFAALAGLPIAIQMVVNGRTALFIRSTLTFLVALVVPLAVYDSYLYGKTVIAPANILLYNVFSASKGGSSLYGTEPWHYYLVNGFLNWNVAFLLALASPLLLPISSRRQTPIRYVVVGLWTWLLVFWLQPHKEERFLFPIYPMIAVCAAFSADRIFHVLASRLRFDKIVFALQVILVGVFILLSLSRSIQLYRNYHAVSDVYMRLTNGIRSGEIASPPLAGSHPMGVCVGKEWHRFPSSFWLPAGTELRFLRSEFRGQLPQPFARLPIPQATRLERDNFNDMNAEEPDRYVKDPLKECQFIVDFDVPNPSKLEPNYTSLGYTVESWAPFLHKESSHPFFRAFYVPYFSDLFCSYRQYQLLVRSDSTKR